MARQLKKWQGWLLFGGAMVIVFLLGLLCSSMLERRAEVASVFNNRRTPMTDSIVAQNEKNGNLLTGLIGAVALMRPTGLSDMEPKSVMKKFKDKKFAAGCSRDVIRQGAEMLGMELNELIEKTIRAMRAEC